MHLFLYSKSPDGDWQNRQLPLLELEKKVTVTFDLTQDGRQPVLSQAEISRNEI